MVVAALQAETKRTRTDVQRVVVLRRQAANPTAACGVLVDEVVELREFEPFARRGRHQRLAATRRTSGRRRRRRGGTHDGVGQRGCQVSARVAMVQDGLDREVQRALQLACQANGHELLDGGVEAPSAIVAGLPAGERRVPMDAAESLAAAPAATPLVLLCQEQLVRGPRGAGGRQDPPVRAAARQRTSAAAAAARDRGPAAGHRPIGRRSAATCPAWSNAGRPTTGAAW